MSESLARSVPIITVKNTSDRPVPIKSDSGATITIMPNAITQISADFASSLPRVVRIMTV